MTTKTRPTAPKPLRIHHGFLLESCSGGIGVQ